MIYHIIFNERFILIIYSMSVFSLSQSLLSTSTGLGAVGCIVIFLKGNQVSKSPTPTSQPVLDSLQALI